MNLDEYSKNLNANAFWQLSDGEKMNLLDGAIERIVELEAENAKIKDAFSGIEQQYTDALMREERLKDWRKRVLDRWKNAIIDCINIENDNCLNDLIKEAEGGE